MLSKGKNNQQPTKDLKIYELELLVKDLKAQLKEHNGLRDKLELANRNSCVLEEENANLIVRLRGMENGTDDPNFFASSAGAMKLIRENNDLRQALEDSLLNGEKSREDFQNVVHKLQGQISELTDERDRMIEENERLVGEVESARHQNFELKNSLEGELVISKAEIDVLAQEKERLAEKNDVLTSSKKLSDGTRGDHSGPYSRSDTAAVSLKERLLKKHVEELEVKLKASEERLWKKENEWLLAEAKFKSEISTLKENNIQRTNNKEVYHALNDQISTLKRELATFRENSHPICEHSDAKHTHDGLQFPLDDDMMNRIDTNKPSVDTIINNEHSLPERQLALHNRINSLTKERDGLRENVENLKTTLLQLQSDIEEKEVRCRELEMNLTTKNIGLNTMHTKLDSQLESDYGLQRNDNHLAQVSKFTPNDEVAALKHELRELQSQLNDSNAIQKQKDALHNVRLTEYQKHLEELLDENDSLCQRLKSSCEKTGTISTDQECLGSVFDFAREKREAVNDIMCQLEAAWAKEGDISRQMRKSNKQGITMARCDAIKDDDICQLQGTIVDLENQLIAEQSKQNLINELKGELVQKSDEILFLNNEINALSEDLHDARKAKQASSRGFEKEGMISKRRSRGSRSMSTGGRSRGARSISAVGMPRETVHDSKINALEQQLVEARNEISRIHSRISNPSWNSVRTSNEPASVNSQVRTPRKTVLLSSPTQFPEETSKIEVLEGAHLAVTIVQLSNLMRKGYLITDPGYVIIKLKSVKEKYKTSVKELKTVISFDEAFQFFLAKPNQDVITLHVFYKSKNNSYVYHIGDACFSMATLCRGIPRCRSAPVVQYPGTDNACRAGNVEVILKTNDFGRMYHPSDAEIEEETLQFRNLTEKIESAAPEKLHAVDVYMASSAFL